MTVRAQDLGPGLLDRVEAGESIVIERDGRPVARLVRAEEHPDPRSFGHWRDRWDVSAAQIDAAFSPDSDREAADLFSRPDVFPPDGDPDA